jgi:hypothetical protein
VIFSIPENSNLFVTDSEEGSTVKTPSLVSCNILRRMID